MNKIELYKGYLAQDPTNEALLFSLAKLLHENGDFVDSLNLLDNYLVDHPNHEIALSRKASVLISSGLALDAKEILKSLVTSNSNSVELKHNLSVATFYCKEIDQAITEFEQLQNIENLEASSNKYLAACFYSKGEYNKAINYIDKAILIEPSDYLKGFQSVILYTSGKINEAIKIAKNVLNTSPDNLDSLSVLGTFHIEANEISIAYRCFEKMKSINQNDSRAFNGLGLCLMREGKISESIDNFKQASKLSPTNLEYLIVLGWSYINSQNFELAIDVFEKALKINNQFAEAHGGLASSLMHQGKIKLAKHHCDLAFNLDNNCFSAIYCRSILLTLNGKKEKGQTLLANVLDQPIRPEGPTLAQIIEKQALNQQPSSTTQSRLN